MLHSHHNHCEHDVKYCAKCDRPYCAKCSKEWYEQKFTWNWPYYQTTTGYQGAIGLYQGQTNDATKTTFSTAGSTCAHS